MALLNDEQVMLRDMAREWADNESPTTAFRKLRDTAPAKGFDAEAWTTIGQMGWSGIVIPEEFGGTAFGYLSLGLVVEQLGRNLGGSDKAKQEWLSKLAAGEAVATLAIDEGPVHGGAITASVAGGKLSGTKKFVAEGDGADVFVVAAADGLYLVPAGEGVSVVSRKMVDSRSHADVTFADAPAEKLGGTDLTQAIVDRATAVTAAEMLGMADSAFNQTLDYLKQRVQFGQVLSTFQALQHRMAKMKTELELMRSAVEGALEAIDAGRSDVDQAVSLAKAVANDTLRLVSREMVQLYGGVGMTDEYDAGLYLKRSAVLENMWGTASYHRDRFARLNGY